MRRIDLFAEVCKSPNSSKSHHNFAKPRNTPNISGRSGLIQSVKLLPYLLTLWWCKCTKCLPQNIEE